MRRNTNKASKASEILWFAVAVLSLFAAVHKTINFGFNNAWYFYGFVIIAAMMYYIRRNMRKKM